MGAVLSLSNVASNHYIPGILSSTNAALHLFSYSALFGMTIYQTFVMTSLAFKALLSGPFTTLQKRVFPAYFSLQSALSLATLLTYPFPPMDLFRTWDAWLLLTTGAMALLNWQWYGPLTSRIMSLRLHQEHKDGRSHKDSEKSEDMKRLNRKFSAAHAMSIHLNLIAVLAISGYGIRLASKIDLQ